MDKGKSLLKSYTFHTSRPKERGIKGVRLFISFDTPISQCYDDEKACSDCGLDSAEGKR